MLENKFIMKSGIWGQFAKQDSFVRYLIRVEREH
jgi:hypothetical protein